MPVPSLASAAEPKISADIAPLSATRTHLPARPLWRDALGAMLWRSFEPLLFRLRQSWLYRLSFNGPITDRILYPPSDSRPCRLDEADALMRGRFRLAGHVFDVRSGSIFDVALPNREFAAALHGFEWLRHVEVARSEHARLFALRLTQQWLRRHGRPDPFSWQPEIIAERFLNLFAHSRFFLVNSDLVWRSRLFVSLRNQACWLARSLGEAEDGLPRLKAAAALTLAGLCLADARNLAIGLKRLTAELERQILADGGHVTRAPQTLLEAYRVLMMVAETLGAARSKVPPQLFDALDAMAPMLRFFRMGDGKLTCFHGGAETDHRVLTELLERDATQARPETHAFQSGYQRIAGGRVTVLFDVGAAPQGPFSRAAHAGCLAFEMSSGGQRMVVNCGPAPFAERKWDMLLRSTAAHSTLTLKDTSSAFILSRGRYARLLGPRLVNGPLAIETRRSDGAQGQFVVAQHDGYRNKFGIFHQRRLVLSPRGVALSGTDRLIPERPARVRRAGAPPIPFAIRFHIHPDVRLSLARGAESVLLKLPNGEGWRFRCAGRISIEESVYFGSGHYRRAEQLVVSGTIGHEPVECTWVFEQLGG
jgi:uncharacterized heparinase superfamily protein